MLLRELSVSSGGSELIVLLALAGWLLGSGLGATVGRRGAPSSGLAARLGLLAYALLLPTSVAAARSLRWALGTTPGLELPLAQQLGGAALVLLPSALLAGALFRWSSRAWLSPERSVAQAYGLESAGALLGGVASSGLALVGLSNLALALLTGLVGVVAAALPGPGRPRWIGALSLPCSLLLVLLLAGSGPLDRALTSLEHPFLIETRDTPYGRVSVERRGEQVVVYRDGALSFESQGHDAEAFVHIAALMVDPPRKVLMLGGAGQGLLRPLLQHHPDRVELVEPDEALFELLVDALPEPQARALREGARLVVDDPRGVLERLGRYDLILLAQPEPSSAAASRTWTLEFFSRCAAHLEPGGVLAFQLPGAENLRGPALTWRDAGIRRALDASFDEVLVLPGSPTTWLASRAPLERSAPVLGRRMVARRIESDLVSEDWLDWKLHDERAGAIARELGDSDALANSDDRPAVITSTLLLWLARFQPSLAARDPGERLHAILAWGVLGLGGGALGLLSLAVLARRWVGPRRWLLAALAGLLGTLLESVLLLGFQLRHGALYGHIGLLLGAFMAGLALGALGWDRLRRRLGVDEPDPWLGRSAGVAALAVGGAVLASTLGEPTVLGSAALLLAAGAASAALFGLASSLGNPDQARAVGPLYGADLLGGCAGFLLATLFAVPLLGLTQAAGLALGLAVVVLVLVL